jgi:predicted AlkP superfamily phosphohydrolase/phosphomutase
MADYPKRLILIGLDGAAVEEVQRHVEAGVMPNTKALMARGTSGNLMPVYPTLTPTNWTTISTGSWPSTHGITDFWLHLPGTPLNQIEYAFDTAYCKAEYIWDAAERAGKRSILVKYESSWPPTHKNGYQVEGLGPGGTSYFEIAGDTLFSTNTWPLVTPIRMQPAEGWSHLPESKRPPLETQLIVQPKLGRLAVKREASDAMRRSIYTTGEDKVFHVLVTAAGEKGYDRITVCSSRDGADRVCELGKGEWSDWHIVPFSLNDGVVQGAVRFKVLKLSPDAKTLEVFLPQVFPTTGYFFPENLGEELLPKLGPFIQNPGRNARQYRWIDDDDFMELVDYHHRWLGGAASHLMQTKPWDLCFVETHIPDYLNHLYLNELDPLNKIEPGLRQMAKACFERSFASIDRMIGQIIADADDETLVIVVADHGGTATTAQDPGSISMALEKAGLLTVITDETTRARRIDWSKTRAVNNMHHIWVNLKGRDPDGIVAPEDYEKTCDEIIGALYDHRDRLTGRPIISLALRRDDARILGLHGDRTGDVIWAILADYDQAHGSQLSNAVHGISSIRSAFIMAGPGVKAGHTLQQDAFLTSVTPTIAYLMRLPMPHQAEGPVLYDALENPDGLVEDLRTMQEERDRWKAAYEAYQNLTHVG